MNLRHKFIIVAAVSAISAGAFAAGNSSVVALYTCPDGCSVNSDANNTKFDCVYPEGKTCGSPMTNIFVPEISEAIANVLPKSQPKSETKKKSEPVSARAAAKPISVTQTKQRQLCPDGCFFGCPIQECKDCPVPPCGCYEETSGPNGRTIQKCSIGVANGGQSTIK
ncbi:MAG: hypothetical protein J5608_01995 [Alphaproteobacteria bacterium]|nr:hypothetical protein [Alphaproteobacteria bacterium]